MRWTYVPVFAVAILGLLCATSDAAPRVAKPRPDLADVAQGEYDGDVVSDARGESRSGVHITVTKVAPNTVQVTSDYERLPPFKARLTRAMSTIQKVGGPQVFLLDLSKSPHGLDLTDDDASWSGALSN